MSGDYNIYIASEQTPAEFAQELGAILGITFLRITGEMMGEDEKVNPEFYNQWLYVFDDPQSRLHLNINRHDYNGDRAFDFENYQYELGVVAVHIEDGTDRHQLSGILARQIFDKIKASRRYRLMFLEDIQVMIEKYHPNPTPAELDPDYIDPRYVYREEDDIYNNHYYLFTNSRESPESYASELGALLAIPLQSCRRLGDSSTYYIFHDTQTHRMLDIRPMRTRFALYADIMALNGLYYLDIHVDRSIEYIEDRHFAALAFAREIFATLKAAQHYRLILTDSESTPIEKYYAVPNISNNPPSITT